MTGPPGTGKTLLAKAVATVWFMPLYPSKINQLSGMWNNIFQCYSEHVDIQMARRFREISASMSSKAVNQT